jgi:hypothetical protein
MPLPKPSFGFAVQDLGLGDMLRDQVTDETEEQRKKRMQQQQQGFGLAGQTPAQTALFGTGGMGGL